jgi:hypothetical protein
MKRTLTISDKKTGKVLYKLNCDFPNNEDGQEPGPTDIARGQINLERDAVSTLMDFTWEVGEASPIIGVN